MTDELRKIYAKRISQASRTELIVIMFDMFNDYIKDAKKASQDGDVEKMRKNIRQARKVVNRLIESLDLKYDISIKLMSIYLFINRELLKADIHADVSKTEELSNMMSKLQSAFKEIGDSEDEEPVMKNVQSVYAGLTYGRRELNEYVDTAGNREFKI